LVQANGELISIPRVEIEERIRQPVSAMPDGLANQLNPQQTADLIRFVLDAGQTPALLATVSAGPTGKADELVGSAFKPGWSSGRGSGIPADDSSASSEVSFDDTGSSLRIRVGRQQIGEYVYRHDRILRPFFAHMKTPLGPQVTRTFPPGEGDRQDHADMHPGIWLAFGDISGVDFWRNQGVVRHQRFLEDPTGGDGEGRFRELKRYLNPSGDVVCREEFGCVVRVTAEGYVLEFTSEFFSDGDHEFSFGDQEEMGLGIRVATKVAEIAGSRLWQQSNHFSPNLLCCPGRSISSHSRFSAYRRCATGLRVRRIPGSIRRSKCTRRDRNFSCGSGNRRLIADRFPGRDRRAW
jgi:hypothetical protein